MSEYKLKRAIKQFVACPTSKYVLCLLSYCSQFSFKSLMRDTELTIEQIEQSLDYLINNKFIKFKEGSYEGSDGTEYQIEILF